MLLHKQKITATALACLLPALAMAQATASATEPVAAKPWFTANPVLVGLALVMVLLLVAVYFTGKVVRNLSQIAGSKIREERKNNTGKSAIIALLMSVGSLLGSTGARAQAVAATGDPVTSSVIDGIPKTEFYVLIVVLLVLVTALVVLMRRVNKILNYYKGGEQAIASAATATVPAAKRLTWWDKFNASVPMEKEKDLLLDHNYDGIQELDNSLPPWWLYGFYATIIFSCIYLWRYHVTHSAPSQLQELAIEMQKGEEEKAKFLATSGGSVDENTVVLSTSASDLAAGKQIFETACAACHLKDGGGQVGPNLTDDYWIHGGSIKDIFKTIKYGVVEKGMKSWEDDYTPMQMAQLASFVKSLHGTKPAVAKEPQGDLYKEDAAAAPAAGSDSTKTAAQDSTAKK